ncbi:AcvB/VirJ family lysyl-phosphatidylglycerol hydrolase [Radicibacter daui]|uniref:AcvB/VirJ family lysyl-phosphatidylglycerol hydrolase n=1 Tax=Radicibacter daui TaxID=3064829 RepID=UPI004046AD17
MKKLVLAGMALVLAAAGGTALEWRPLMARFFPPDEKIASDNVPETELMLPKGAPLGFAVFVSGMEGWTPQRQYQAKALVDAGMIVLPVDGKSYLAGIDKASDDCIYTISDFEGLARNAGRALGLSTYFRPVIVGAGIDAGTLAYASLANAPDNTIAGAVALGFSNHLASAHPFCPGPTQKEQLADGAWSYGFDGPMVAPMTFITNDADTARIDPSYAAHTGVRVVRDNVPEEEAHKLVVEVTALARADALVASQLPITTLGPQRGARAVAVIWSGDGGWRDIDEGIGETLAGKGFAVAGFDSLRYFWAERKPEEMARDMAIAIKRADPTGKLPVLLAGYSFGANTLPFAWQYLDPAIRDRTQLIALLAPEPKTGFEIKVDGWLGRTTGEQDVTAAIATLPANTLGCYYGAEEEESGCTGPGVSPQSQIKLEGGHHFDGDYEKLASTLLQHFHVAIASR